MYNIRRVHSRAAIGDFVESQTGTGGLRNLASRVQQCGNNKDLTAGKQAHKEIIRCGYDGKTLLRNLLVEMYGKCGSVEDAKAVFDTTRKRNVYSWTILIAAYAQNGHSWEAVRAFRTMDLEGIPPNEVTFVNLLTALTGKRFLSLGRCVHSRIVAEGLDSDMMLNTLMSMYGKCESLVEAKQVFREMQLTSKSSITWNAVIAAHTQAGHCDRAFRAFAEMDLEGVAPDRVTYMHVVDVCTRLGAVDKGMLVHMCYEANGVLSELIDSSLVKMYGKCGRLAEAEAVFQRMAQRDLVSWTAMLAAYAQHGHGREAIELFRRMDLEGLKPDVVAYSSVLDACGTAAAFSQGKCVHDRVVSAGLEQEMILANCIVEMYGKCGRLDEARRVFDAMETRDIVSWTTMIAAYAQNGHSQESLQLYAVLQQEGGKPDEVTLVTILAACSQSGLLNDGWRYFTSMRYDHGILAQGAHLGCVIDLLGRAGKLELAEELMAESASSLEWTSFMAACAVHNDSRRAQRASKMLSKIDPSSSSGYVLMANVCGS